MVLTQTIRVKEGPAVGPGRWHRLGRLGRQREAHALAAEVSKDYSRISTGATSVPVALATIDA